MLKSAETDKIICFNSAYTAVILAIISCFTDKFENILDVFGLAIPMVMFVCALIFRMIDKRMSK